MKRLFYLVIPVLILASCSSNNNKQGKDADELAKLKKERSDIDVKIKKLEGNGSDSSKKATPVSIMDVQPTNFVATVNVQAQITSDDNVYATAQAGGTIKDIKVHVGDHVTKGQVLATLDAAAAQQQVESQAAQLAFSKTMYEKQQKLWAQNIGTEVQLLQAKANYESAQKQAGALIAQKDMYRIISPISGTVDQVNIKIGDVAAPGISGIRVVNGDKLKAEANLGENYLGKIHVGNSVTLVFPDLNDSMKTAVTYVAESVDPSSRAFIVQIKLNNVRKLHPNMSCIMKIANYESKNTIVVPVSVIQKTSTGEQVYVADGNKAKAVVVRTGSNSNGQVEVLSGLSAGDKVITAGFEDLDNGDPITTQQQ